MFLTRISIKQPVFTVMMMLAVLVIGITGYSRLAVDDMPNVDIPVVVVLTTLSGASPESVETMITRPIEQAVNQISGIQSVVSQSRAGVSMVFIQFNLDVDARTASFDVQQKVGPLLSGFPTGTKAPQVLRFDPTAQPIMSLAVFSKNLTRTQLTSLANDVIVRRLNMVEGVGQADVLGGSERQIMINPNMDKMLAYQITLAQIMNSVQIENSDISVGTLNDNRMSHLVIIKAKRRTVDDFRRIIVARNGGAPIYLSDVADVVDGGAQLDSDAFYNGHPAVSISITKNQNANTVAVANQLYQQVAALSKQFADSGVSISVIRDNSVDIKNSVDNVQRMLFEGALLTTVIVFLFLNSWRSTVITGLTLPISVIGTFAFIYFLGFTLNQMTLLALSLSIGILIDDAIVVRENITRHLHMGKSHLRAAIDGTSEIGFAVLATTLSIVAVFLPVAFMGGVIGRFFFQFGFTIVVAVCISLFVSFTLDPMLSSVWKDPAADPNYKHKYLGKVSLKFNQFFDYIAEYYTRVIRWSLVHHIKTSLIAVVIFFISCGLLFSGFVGSEFIPTGTPSSFQIQLRAQDGSSLDYTAMKVHQAEKILQQYPDILDVYSTVNSRANSGYNNAVLDVRLKPRAERQLSTEQLFGQLRAQLDKIAGITVSLNLPGLGGGGKAISLTVLGAGDATETNVTSKKVENALRQIKGVVDVYSNVDDVTPSINIKLRQPLANTLGITSNDVGQALQPLFSGLNISLWDAPNGESYNVVIQLPKLDRSTIEQLKNVKFLSNMKDANGNPIEVTLSEVADVSYSNEATTIYRRDQMREIQISANVDNVTTGQVISALQQKIKTLDLPPTVQVKFTGNTQEMEKSFSYALQAFALIIVLIYLVLASQFASFFQPFAIMATLPFSLIGVILALLITGSTINMLSIIGFLILMGLVTKNSILLIDYSNQLRREGWTLADSLVEAGRIRFRPIMMTTLAMIFGMLPIALGLGEGGDALSSMAHAVIGGLISSTLLTLIVIPVVITYVDRLEQKMIKISPFHVDHEGIKNLDKHQDSN